MASGRNAQGHPIHIPDDDCAPDCFACKCSSLQFLSMAPQAAEARSRERQFSKDSAAYRRLRAQGIQPNHVDGSAMAEKMATHPIEIEIGRDLHPIERKALVRTNGTI